MMTVPLDPSTITLAPERARSSSPVTPSTAGRPNARAAARFVKLADQFDAEIVVAKNGTSVSGRSIMGLMMLAAGPGTSIELSGSGADAERAIDALVALIRGGFDEE